MTREEFRTILAPLASLPFPPADDDAHWMGLADIAADDLRHAVLQAAKWAGRFPPPSKLREWAEESRASRTAHLPPPPAREIDLPTPVQVSVPSAGRILTYNREYRYDCEECQDSGWAIRWCGDREGLRQSQYGLRSGDCGRYNIHAAHEYAAKCECIHTNPTIQRQRAAARRYIKSEPTKRHWNDMV